MKYKVHWIIDGIIAIKERKSAPGRMILFNTFVKYSLIFSELTPRIDPPFSLICRAISIGFRVTCV